MMSEVVRCCVVDCESPAIVESSILELCSPCFEEWKVEFERKRSEQSDSQE